MTIQDIKDGKYDHGRHWLCKLRDPSGKEFLACKDAIRAMRPFGEGAVEYLAMIDACEVVIPYCDKDGESTTLSGFETK